MLNELRVVGYARALNPKIFYTSEQLDTLWKVDKTTRRNILAHMKKRKIIRSRGNTTKIRYQLMPENKWKLDTLVTKDRTVNVKPVMVMETTGNGIIDAKLRKEAHLPETPTSLENLITAATNVGTENEVLKQALHEINAIITRVREYL